jgi:hypothetical protein
MTSKSLKAHTIWRWNLCRVTTPDGQRFVMVQEEEGDKALAANRIHVVLNWFDELKRLVPIE